MLPLVAIVGRPNVGKSTLFNRLVGHRAAITEDTPGVTRDRLYKDADWGGRAFTLVDTGGFLNRSDEPLIEAVREQAQVAIKEAQVIVLVVDGNAGLTSSDDELAQLLRKSGKPVLLAVNKIDGERRELESALADFHQLGLTATFPISAEHGRGLAELLDDVITRLPEETESAPVEGIREIRLAVVGRPNVGKSTFLNKLLGTERFVASALPGTTRDAVDETLDYRGRHFVLTDTAGIRRRGRIDDRVEQFSVQKALSRIEDADVAVVLIDALEVTADQDARIAGLAEEKGRAVVLVINKWDLIEKDATTVAKFREELAIRYKFMAWAPTLFTSALSGQHVFKVLDLAIELFDESKKRVPTPALNAFVQDCQNSQPPPLWRGYPVRFFYAVQVANSPPAFAISCNRPQAVTESYRRFLSNRMRETFGFRVPIRLLFKQKKGAR